MPADPSSDPSDLTGTTGVTPDPPHRPNDPALTGVRVLELGGIGPAPFAGMWFADHGAEVTRVERTGAAPDPAELVLRGRRSVALDLRQSAGRELALDLAAGSDVLLEGFRPGVCERLGLGPQECLQRNPGLVYVRVTGWGQDGPLAARAGHDITYLALTGALWSMRRAGSAPVPPVNLLGDFGGGAMFAVSGALAALVERQTSGRGQVIDAAIIDGVGLFTTFLASLRTHGRWSDVPGTNLLDTGAPFYEVYECADGGFVAVGALEPAFYAELVQRSGAVDVLDPAAAAPLDPAVRDDPARWPAAKRSWARVFATRTRDEWAALFADTDACVAPVLSPAEAAAHPHQLARNAHDLLDDGTGLPAPAPRLSRSAARRADAPRPAGADTDAVLRGLGRTPEQIAQLRRDGVIGGISGWA